MSRWPLAAGLVPVAHFANDGITSMVPALLPSLAGRLQLAPSELALLASTFAIVSALPQPAFGALADRVGGGRVGGFGLAVCALLVVALGSASSPSSLWVVLVISGLGSAAMHPAGIGLARAASGGNPGLAVALFSAGGMAGGALGPLLAVGITGAHGLSGLVWAALPALAVAALFFQFAPQHTRAGDRRLATPSAGVSLLRGHVGRLAIVAFGANLSTLALQSATPVWLVQTHGMAPDSPVIGWTLAAFSIGAAAGGFLGSLLSRWVSRRALVVGSLLLALAALQAVLHGDPGSAPFLLVVAAAGALTYAHLPIVLVRAQELAPGAESTVSGLLLGATSAVAGVAYAGLGVVQEAFGIGTTMAATFFVLVPAAAIAAGALPASERVQPSCALHPCTIAGQG